MPTVLLIRGYRFFFYMNEHEPIHVHVAKADCEARFVLVPEIDMTTCKGFKRNEVRELVELILENYDKLINAWKKTFGK